TDKPYTLIATHKNSFYDNRTLKEFMTFLNPNEFLRVNRSKLSKHSSLHLIHRRVSFTYPQIYYRFCFSVKNE
ncbi:MAG: hypothetical protein AAGJ18_23495, partial [Bacteroidota bacterium]